MTFKPHKFQLTAYKRSRDFFNSMFDEDENDFRAGPHAYMTALI
jgi:hypothetical protein